ncbi:uncharacterized protein DFL_006677 [Arthrobotrys flagrans]|uniref:Uncharacterized protein n=1 Tax=Arthrobotrys flagrans TaxID=97331 RepID=A0A436ZTG1_ARTFL|nr:hypothetical protein DFL_006677 [Arthrobotrys flagrans]
MASSRISKPAASSNLGNAAKIRKEKTTAKSTLKSRLLQRRQGITANDAPDSSFWDIETTENYISMNQQRVSQPKRRNDIVEASVWDLPLTQEEVVTSKKKPSLKIPVKNSSPKPKYKSTIKATSKLAKKLGPDDDYIPDESSQIMPKTKKVGQRKMPARKTKVLAQKVVADPSSPISPRLPVTISSPLPQSIVEAQDKTLVQEPETVAKKARPVYLRTAEAIEQGIGAPLALRMSQSVVIKAVAVPTEDPIRHYSPLQSPVDTSMGVLEDTTLVPDELEAESAV